VATRQALRIDTLHGPSRQILHVSPPVFFSGGLQVEPAPAGTMRELFRSGSLDQKRNGKVAGILRPRTCGVKRKDTISSGRVAKHSSALNYCVSGEKPLALYNARGFAHNLSCPDVRHEEFLEGKGSECGMEVRARCSSRLF